MYFQRDFNKVSQ